MPTDYTIIANWKMYLSYHQATDWAKKHGPALKELAQSTKNTIIICPSYESLAPLYGSLKFFTIKIGAQNCSEHALGAYTGQIAAQSLAEIGCTYCIIGHSEQRHAAHESNTQIAHKMEQLLNNALTPIICIGETKQDYEQEKTLDIIEEQLNPLAQIVQKITTPTTIYIAYEPIWSIGTGDIPQTAYLGNIFAHIKSTVSLWPKNVEIKLLYGGSIDDQTCIRLKGVTNLEGFLVGKASIDFQKLKKIVLSL